MVDRFELCLNFKQAVREAATTCPRPCKFNSSASVARVWRYRNLIIIITITITFDILTLKVVFRLCSSHVTWATSVPILVFLGLSFYRLRPDGRYRQTSDVRQTPSCLTAITDTLSFLYFNYFQDMYFVFCILPVIAKVIEKVFVLLFKNVICIL